MARGWESKNVEAQQEESVRGRATPGPASEEERATAQRRRTLELARTAATYDLARATAPAHRAMLEQKLAAIEAQLRELK